MANFIIEALKKPFLKTDEIKQDFSVNDPEKVINDLNSDIDLSQLIHNNNYFSNQKEEKLTNEQKIQQYRRLSMSPEASIIVDEIINEIYTSSNDKLPKLQIDDYELPKKLEEKVYESFDKILNLLDFRRNAYDLIKRWYVDSHLFVECVIDNKKPKDGIQACFILDPVGISKNYDEKVKKFVYKYQNSNQNYFGQIDDRIYLLEQLIYINSGLKDEHGNTVGYLQPAIKVNNQMNLIEDMLIVYRITRGTEKRAIRVNVGNMPKTKAINYMNELVNKFKNKKVYNAESGTVDNNSHLISVTEDIWLPTKNSTKDIEIDTLQGGMSLGELDDLMYFKNKLFTALRVPANRFGESSEPLDLTATEINRQELRFNKFISSLRMKFNELFIELLRRDLISTNSMSDKEFKELKSYMRISYPDESEIKSKEKFASIGRKIEIINEMEEYVGKYFSREYIFKEIFEMNDDDIQELKEQLEKEKKEYGDEEEDSRGY